MSHSIMMRRSAITTAMLLQSRRQREIVDLEYAEAEKLLKDAKGQLEQSQAAQVRHHFPSKEIFSIYLFSKMTEHL